MANYSELLNDINAAIYENNDQEIDALEVRAILREMVASLGSGFLFKGIATPSSPSGTGTYEPDQNVFYLATTAGTYTYLGGLVVAAGEVAFLCFDGTWTKKSSALLSKGRIVDNTTTEDATKPLSAKQGKVLADALAATAAEVTALGHEINGIDALKEQVSEVVSPSLMYDDSKGGTYFSEAVYNSVILSTPIPADSVVTGVKMRVYQVSGASYKAKIVTTETTDKLKILSLYEFDLNAPSGTFEDEEIVFDTPFPVQQGKYVGIIVDTNGVLRTHFGEGQSCFPRSVTYANMTTGANVWPYVPTVATRGVSFTLLREETVFKDFPTRDEMNTAIDEEGQELTSLYLNGYPIEWQIGAWTDAGVYNPSAAHNICLKTPIPVKKGQIIRSFDARELKILSVEDGEYSVLANNVYSYVFSGDMFILINVAFSPSAYPVVSDNQIVAVNNGSEIIVIEDYDVRKSYNNWQNEVANYIAVRNSLDLSINEQKMTHAASCEYDSFLKVFWIVYYANNVVTTENSDDTRTYLTLTQFNPYTGTFKRCELLKANETKGGFLQGNMPPYDPAIAGISQTEISILFECFDTQHGIAKMVVNKADFETAVSSGTESALSGLKVCDVVSITKAKLTYGGVQYNVDCSGMKQMYEAFNGQAIGTITDLCISMKPFLYNGIYYATIQDIFNGSGMMPVLMSTTDFVNWSFVKVFNEVTWSTIAESAFVIKDGLIYFCARTATANAVVLVYDITNNSIVCEPYTLQFSMNCKPAIRIFDDRVILACNIPALYESGVGFRKNMGVWEMGADGSCSLLSNILTEDGIHYPDWVSANNELYIVFSTDKRFLNRATQRTNLGFAKILV